MLAFQPFSFLNFYLFSVFSLGKREKLYLIFFCWSEDMNVIRLYVCVLYKRILRYEQNVQRKGG